MKTSVYRLLASAVFPSIFLFTGFITSAISKRTSLCGKTYLLFEQGVIKSPNYPATYPNNISCTWTILPPPNRTVILTLKDLDIEEDHSCQVPPCCTHNWLSVPVENGSSHKQICGRIQDFKVIRTSKNHTTIKFLSSKITRPHRGFLLSYKFESSSCQENEFTCGDGNCLPGVMRCDRVAQCSDQTDEIGCQDDCIGVGKVSCGPQAVAGCFDNVTQRCDGVRDCASGRDEFGCETHRCDRHCQSGECYTMAQACDKIPHCLDFTDEINCGYCSPRQARCGVRALHCFTPATERCDGIFQCPYGEDEVGCVASCNGGIACASGQGCYSILGRCDAQPNCIDGSDEMNCPEDLCRGDNRLCNNAKCVHISLWCNGNDDCGDRSDEENCIRNSVISATIMTCLLCGLLLILAVLCTLRMYTKRTLQPVNYGLQLPPHIATRLSMTHSISLPALIDDEFVHREPPPAYSVAVGGCIEGGGPVVGTGVRRPRARRHRPAPKPPTPPPSSDTSAQSSPSRDSITSSSYLSNDDNILLIDT